MQCLTTLLILLLSFTSLQLQAQNWANGGNTLSANGTIGTNSNHSLLFETNGTERGRITNGGNWGIGIASPIGKFHVNGLGSFGNRATTANATRALNLVDDNAVMRVLRTHASFAPAVELISRTTADGPNVAYWDFYAEPSDKSFRIRDRTGGGAGLDRVTVNNNGNVGIGTLPGFYKMKVLNEGYGLNLEQVSTGNDWELWVSGANSLSLFYNEQFRGVFSSIDGAYSSNSDERLKTNIKPMPSVLDKINQLKPTTYQFKAGRDTEGKNPESYGFLAQDVLKIFPHLVSHHIAKERGVDTYTLDYSGFSVIAIKAIQELMKKTSEIEVVKQQNDYLKKELADLKQLVSRLANEQNINTSASNASLLQNSPNPVRGLTAIKYSLPEGSSRAQLLLTDALGSTVKAVQLTSSGVVNLDVSSLSSGVYNYSLVVDGKTVQTRKMTVER